jgi:hypothetical protein
MPESTKDNNTIGTKCGYHGNCFLRSVDSLTSLLEMLRTAIKSLRLSFKQSNFVLILRDFETMHFKLKRPYKA